MNSQQLLYINLGIGLFFVLYFLFFRSKPKPPVRLNLRAKSSLDLEAPQRAQDVELQKQEREAKVAEVLTGQPSKEAPVIEEPVLEAPAIQAVRPQELGIYFVYNAHEWECHDVLGVPRGCSLQIATQKFQQLIKTSDPSTFPFYEAAFDAILKKKGAR